MERLIAITVAAALTACATADVLLVGGHFTVAGGLPARYIAQWDGEAWWPVGNGFDWEVYGLAMFQGAVHATGNFSGHVARWDGGGWVTVGQGLNGPGLVLQEFQGMLYVGGAFTSADNVPVRNLARWNGTAWTSVADMDFNNSVLTMVVFENTLIVGGTFYGQPFDGVARWDGQAWSSVGVGIGGGGVYALYVYRGMLTAGGGFRFSGNESVVMNKTASWNGTDWLPMGQGIVGGSARVVSFIEDTDGGLIAGGQFEWADGLRAMNLARWDSTSWSPLLAGGTDREVERMVYFRDSLVLVGWFTLAGNTSVSHITELREDGPDQPWLNVGGGVTGGYNEILRRAQAILIVDSLL